MIRWLWLIPTLAVGAAIGFVLMGWLVSGKITDLERKIAELKRDLWFSDRIIQTMRSQVVNSN